VFVGGAVLVVACNAKVADDGATDGDVDAQTPPRVPVVHRSVAMACSTVRPPSTGTPPSIGGATCASDADCAAGRNGRCSLWLPEPPKCTYDECLVDADCGAAHVCTCRDLKYGNDACTPAGCRVDADCGGNYCSPSYGACRNEGVADWQCHSRADECVDDADCAPSAGGEPSLCSYDRTRGLWACVPEACPL